MIFAADDRLADRSLGGVVVERNSCLLYELCEAVSVGDDVRGGVAGQAKDVGRLAAHLRDVELVQSGANLGETSAFVLV